MKLNYIIAVTTGILAYTSAMCQNIMLNMSKQDFIAAIGTPDVIVPTTTPNSEKAEQPKQSVVQEGGSDNKTDDTFLQKHVGTLDNLQSIITLKETPLKLEFEQKQSTRGENKEVIYLTCVNEDWCGYTIKMRDGAVYKMFSGKTVIEDVKNSFSYVWFRGEALSKVNVKYPYAIPSAPGTKVKFINDPREQYRSFVVLMNTGEPVFAMRGGMVCKTDNEFSVLVSHKDGTFAAYMNVDNKCVYPGDSVNPGDRIGECGAGKLSISIFYLDENKIQGNSNHYTHLTPYIRTDQGDAKLETDVEYVAVIDEDIITKEMSGLQKKKYQKTIFR